MPEGFGRKALFLDATESLGCMRSARARPDLSGQRSAIHRPDEETMALAPAGALAPSPDIEAPHHRKAPRRKRRSTKTVQRQRYYATSALKRPSGRASKEEAKETYRSGRWRKANRKGSRPRTEATRWNRSWRSQGYRRKRNGDGGNSKQETARWKAKGGGTEEARTNASL